MPPLRLGVIGTGLIWLRTHKPILETLSDTFTLAAFSDVDEQRRRAVAGEFPDARVVSDYQQLLELPEIDVVLVLTPLTLNAPVARAALLAGKHVIMEKPIARSLEEGRDLIATARSAGKLLCVTEQMAYRDGESVLAETIASGEIGELVMWECVHHMEGDTAPPPLRYDSTPWRKQADFPLGTMFDGGVHLIASLSKVFGVPEFVFATGRQLRPDYGEYDHITAMFQYPGNVNGMLSYSSYLPSARNHLHVYGSEGVIVVERERLTVEKADQPPRVIELARQNPYIAMWHALCRAFSEQHEPLYTPERALSDVATLLAVDQSIKTGERAQVSNAAPV